VTTTDDEDMVYNNGEWHEVTVRRQGINGSVNVTGIASGTRTHLSTK